MQDSGSETESFVECVENAELITTDPAGALVN